MKKNLTKTLSWTAGLLLVPLAHAGTPVFTFEALTPTTVAVPANDTASVMYQVTNQSRKPHTIAMRGIPGVTQVTTNPGTCANPMTLAYLQSCSLELQVRGAGLLPNGVHGGPVVCQVNSDGSPNPNLCYQPSLGLELNLSVGAAIPAFHVGGSVQGLAAGQTVSLLQDDSGDTLTISSNSTFQFPSELISGTPYNVLVSQQPATQNCQVTNGSGTITNADVTNVLVSCSSSNHIVTAHVLTLAPLTAPNTLQLTLNGTSTLSVDTVGDYPFAQQLTVGTPFTVTATTPGQTCTVQPASGTVESNVDVNVFCSTNSYTVGGSITGLTANGLQLSDASAGTVSPSSGATSFTLPNSVAAGSAYNVTITQQPVGQFCDITPNTGVGTVPGANVTSVAVVCSSTSYTLSGNLTGLDAGATVTLTNTANGERLPLTDSTPLPYSFNTRVPQGGSYNIVIDPDDQPPGQHCVVANHTGNNVMANVTNLDVSCVARSANLTVSTNLLALSVTNRTEFGVPVVGQQTQSGRARMIVITNTGNSAATNLTITPPSNLPGGTNASNNCGSSLAAGASCFITIVPGPAASNNSVGGSCNGGPPGSVPTPSVFSISAANANEVSSAVVILEYNCFYQGGRVFAFDDTQGCTTVSSCTGSVGGKVLSAMPVSTNLRNWSATDTGAYDGGVAIYGISEISTVNNANPGTGPVEGQTACNGAIDGKCDTNNILAYYSGLSIPTPLHTYPAGLCKQHFLGIYTNWYLPSICELGPSALGGTFSEPCGTVVAPLVQNIAANAGFALGTPYNVWSSTELSTDPKNQAWIYIFNVSGLPAAGFTPKNSASVPAPTPMDVFCVRAMTQPS